MTTVVGLVAWIIGLLTLPTPLAARMLLLAPLMIVPRLLAYVPRRPLGPERLAGWPALLAALPLVVAFAEPAGPLAAVLTVPWLGLSAFFALAALLHGLPRLPELVRPARAAELGIDTALGFLAIGAMFVFIDRLGLGLLGFSDALILLTAVHFHVAGFGLLILTSLLAANRRWLRAAVVGLVVGIPITAAGFVLGSSALNALGALVVGWSGIGVAVALLNGVDVPGWRRWFLRLAGAVFMIGMPMGIAYAGAIALGQHFLDLDTMVRTHGALNGVGVTVATLVYRNGGRT
ncbi:MAG: YndJ family transporter [Candidatus Limnocylindrales bacterium]